MINFGCYFSSPDSCDPFASRIRFLWRVSEGNHRWDWHLTPVYRLSLVSLHCMGLPKWLQWPNRKKHLYRWYTFKTPDWMCESNLLFFVENTSWKTSNYPLPLRQPLETTLLCLDVGLCSDACNFPHSSHVGILKRVFFALNRTMCMSKPMYSVSSSRSKQIPTPNIMQNSEINKHPAAANRIQQLVASIHIIFNSLKKRLYQLHRLEQCDEA